MARKVKKPPFKKGDEVIYLDGQYYRGRTTVTEAMVTAIRMDGDHYIVHTKHFDRWNNEWRRAFTTQFTCQTQVNPRQVIYPIWQLVPNPGKEFVRGIKKRLDKANKKREQWFEQMSEICKDVESEARKWRDAEEKRRIAELPNMQHHVERVVSRAGFKKPKVAI